MADVNVEIRETDHLGLLDLSVSLTKTEMHIVFLKDNGFLFADADCLKINLTVTALTAQVNLKQILKPVRLKPVTYS